MPQNNERDTHPGFGRRLVVRAVVPALLLGLAAILAPTSASAAPAAAATIRPVSYWEAQFAGVAASNRAENLPLSLSSDSWNYYGLAYAIDANVSMFEATSKTAYLDQALAYTTNMVSRAKPSSALGSRAFGDHYLGWVSQRSDVKGQEVPLFESYAWRYVARMLRVMHDSPQVHASSAYRAKYNELLHFTEVNIFDKWMSRGANSYVYRMNTHMASHWAYIALELERLTTDPARRARARRVVDNIDLHMPNFKGASLKGQMRRLKSGAFFWSADWGSTARPGQDVAHGNAVASYVTEARDLGTTWTATDMTALSRTLTADVMPKAANVDGTGAGSGWLADGFVKLGRYSLAVQQQLEKHAEQGQAQYMASMAVNARRLTSPDTAPVPTRMLERVSTSVTPPHVAARSRLSVTVARKNLRHRTHLAITARGAALRRGRQVRLQRLQRGSWQTVVVRQANAHTTCRFTTSVHSSGTQRFRVRAAATPGAARVTSAPVTLSFPR